MADSRGHRHSTNQDRPKKKRIAKENQFAIMLCFISKQTINVIHMYFEYTYYATGSCIYYEKEGFKLYEKTENMTYALTP